LDLPDVNVLIYSSRKDSPDHDRFAEWLGKLVNGDEAFAISDLVLSAYLRVTTHPKIFKVPSTMGEALTFAEALRSRPNCVKVMPGARHWEIFTRLCRSSGVKGTLVPDAYFAALAIEWGCRWVTTDRDFSRFPGLRWGPPFGEG
jgi:toxin-antitoxin system PIN domain toxin